MALNKNVKYVNQITQDEHDDTANVEVKKSGEYGWDADNLKWKRIAVDANGQQTVTIDTTSTNLVVESAPLAHEGLLDNINTGVSNLSGDIQSVATTQTDGSQKTQVVDSGGVNVSLATSTNQATANTLLGGIAGFTPSVYDYISLTYTGSNLTGVVFKTGGSGGTTVATLTLAYSGSTLTSVTKT